MPAPRSTMIGLMSPDDHVAIIGGGFSGALMAINLFRFDGPRATLIERSPARLGRGIAYGSAHPSQLLNVRAAAMSAFPDDPGHFTRWLAQRDTDGPTPAAFVARSTYGAYLRETLLAVQAAAGDRLTILADEVLTIARQDGTRHLTLRHGGTLAADAVVLALGNLPPHAPPGIDAAVLPPDVYVHNPWTRDPAAGLVAGDRVVLVGSGLTAIDMVLQLDAAGFDGTILALSRRGQDHPVATTTRRIVNCTGPQGDVLRSDEPLVRHLVESGMIRPDALRLGIDVDDGSHVVDAAGIAQPDLYCIGPMTRGSFWEIVAVPDLRRQCAGLGRRLSNAHWVNEGL